MKYQQIIMGQQPDEGTFLFRQFYVPVELRDGRWLPCGDMREETSRVTQGEIMLGAAEYDPDMEEECGPLADITPPPGWEVMARLWLEDNYVPESAEVHDETQRRAIEKLKSMGLWREPND